MTLGGSGEDYGAGVAVDATGNAFVSGTTTSADFPLLDPIIDAGSGSAFIVRLDTTGQLAFSTRLGAGGEAGSWSRRRGMALDAVGNLYTTGDTSAAGFPLVAPVQATFGGLRDAFVAKVVFEPFAPPPPEVNDDWASTTSAKAVTIDVLANDSTSGEFDLTTLEVVTSPTSGMVEVGPSSGQIFYTPTPDIGVPTSSSINFATCMGAVTLPQ